MPQDHNFYHMMLGLSESVASPNAYELLGLNLFEDDEATIREAAVDANQKLMAWQNSQFHVECDRLMGKVVKARDILIDAKRRSAYDERLKKQLGIEDEPEMAEDFDEIALAPLPTWPVEGRQPIERETDTSGPSGRDYDKLVLVGLGGLVGVFVLIGVTVLLLRDSGEPSDPVGSAATPEAASGQSSNQAGPMRDPAASETAPAAAATDPVNARPKLLHSPETLSPENAASNDNAIAFDSAAEFEDWSEDGQATLRHGSPVRSLAFSPHGKTLASGGQDGTIKLWDMRTGKQSETFRGHASYVHAVTFSPDGRTLASGSADNSIKLWNTRTGRERTTLEGHTAYVRCVTFSHDGKTLASASGDKTVKLWDVGKGQERNTLQGHNYQVDCVAFSPDSTMLASAGFDTTVALWDAEVGQQRATLQGHRNSVSSVAFARDGKTLASASHDGTIKLWDTKTNQEEATIKGQDIYAHSLTFLPDGKTLASGALDGTLSLWDLGTRQQRTLATGHNKYVFSTAFSPDGNLLASASADKTIRLQQITSSSGERVATQNADLQVLRERQNQVVLRVVSRDNVSEESPGFQSVKRMAAESATRAGLTMTDRHEPGIALIDVTVHLDETDPRFILVHLAVKVTCHSEDSQEKLPWMLTGEDEKMIGKFSASSWRRGVFADSLGHRMSAFFDAVIAAYQLAVHELVTETEALGTG